MQCIVTQCCDSIDSNSFSGFCFLLLPGDPSEADGVFQTSLTQARYVHYAAKL
jgi:hypothetical protein